MSRLIGIAGCGGIGSNVAKHLVRSGYRDFVLVDFDKLEESNLNRQFFFKKQIAMKKIQALAENLKQINPDLNLRLVDKCLDKTNILETFADCEIIIEGLDDKEIKAEFFEKVQELTSMKLYVGANGIAGDNPELVKIQRLNEKCFFCGDFQSDTDTYITTSYKVGVVAAFMASLVDREVKQWEEDYGKR